jgi:hypothetical protein
LSVKQEQTEKALEAFLKYTVSQAKANLTRRKKNSTRALYDSLDYEYNVSKNSFSASITALDYGEFQDKGVSGKKKKYNTPYSYKDKMPPASAFDKWIVRKGIAPRNEQGQFQTRKGIAFAIARSVFINGIKPSRFLSDPFEKGFKRLPDEIIEAFGLDVETFLKQIINNGKTS